LVLGCEVPFAKSAEGVAEIISEGGISAQNMYLDDMCWLYASNIRGQKKNEILTRLAFFITDEANG
jgi:hypothetical protein